MAYKISEATREALIQAGGELCAQYGPDAVTMRDLTRRASVRPSAVNYHFGNRDGLIRAVYERALSSWKRHDMQDYFNTNTQLLSTHDGKVQMVRDVIALLFRHLYSEGQPKWINVLIIRTALTESIYRRDIKKVVLQEIADFLRKVYMAVSENHDDDTARCWALSIVGSATLLTSNLTPTQSGLDGAIPVALYLRLEYITVQNALFAAGLI